MSGHTPGPWVAREADEHQRPKFWINAPEIKTPSEEVRPNGKFIAAVGTGYGDPLEIAANARLIAAAPDLLEAIKALLGPDVMGGKEEAFDPVGMAMRAISKAEGR